MIGVDVSIGNREVTHWDQPMVKAAQEGIMGFLVKKLTEYIISWYRQN